jgi:tRNA (guanine-N7-)-methyltransferase
MRVRHHVNPLRAEFLAMQARPIALGNEPVEVELGCADARFLFERAREDSRTRFIGLEIREPLVEWVNQTARASGVPNVEAHFAHIGHHLDVLFPDERLQRVFVNFPDPWFKRRHEKRRLMSEELAELIARKLPVGGELFFQSDVFVLALDALAVLEDSPRFRNVSGPWSFTRENPYNAKSLREVRCEERGFRIWRMLFKKIR